MGQKSILNDDRVTQFLILNWKQMELLELTSYLRGIAAGRQDLWDDCQFLSDLAFTKYCLEHQLEFNFITQEYAA